MVAARKLVEKNQGPLTLVSQKPFVSWKKLKTLKTSNTPIASIPFDSIGGSLVAIKDVEARIVTEGAKFGYTVVCNHSYPLGLFQPVYFTEIEKSIGHTRDIKTFQLVQSIDYIFDLELRDDCYSLVLSTCNVEPQILSDPITFLTKIKYNT